MSMLAEKKRREKWSLNPRGKAWSEDQNKFGQRLLEKMGWKAGQGLGAKSQGQTDIVKTRLKNDSKGLGFKENGEEWLKTTSDFDNLLDELASSQDESGDKSQTNTPVSLEDRSKNSRSRVHYHKFTRGKDLSRYSEKDLASIIGPDVIKLKNEPESTSDYTQNQVNKGSLKEYFDSKLKSKDGNSSEDVIEGDITDGFKETVISSNSELQALNDNSEHLKMDLESELGLAVSSKKEKKKKTRIDENMAQVNISTIPVIDQVDGNQHDSQTEESGKKKKKRKSGHVVENNLHEHEENNPNDLNSAVSGCSKKVKKENENKSEIATDKSLRGSSDVRQTNYITSKKRKRKDLDYAQALENSAYLDSEKSQNESNADKKTLKKKKKEVTGEAMLESEHIDNCTNNSSVIAETIVKEEIVPRKKKARNENKVNREGSLDVKTESNGECTANNLVIAEDTVISDAIVSKKKKKKNKDEIKNCQEDHVELNEEGSSNVLVAGEDLINDEIVSKKKKKKSKDKNKEPQDDPLEDQTKCNIESRNSMPIDEEVTVKDNIVPKKKKKPKDENLEHPEEPLDEEQTLVKKKSKQEKKIKQLDDESTGTSETAPQCEQVVSRNKCGGFLEVLGRKTRLKNINKLSKRPINDSYKTEEFMSFSKTDNLKKESIDQDRSETNAAVKKVSENRTNSGVAISKDANQNSVIAKPKSVQDKVEKTSKTTLRSGPNNQKITTDKNAVNSKLSTSDKVEKSVNNEKDNFFKCYAEINADDCNLPKHVVAYEYRLVSARLKHLEITPPEVKVILRESNTLQETTRRKLKQIAKTRHLKLLLPPSDLTEIDDSVTKFHENLKPKIEMMTVISEMEEKISEIAGSWDGKAESNEEDAVKAKHSLSEKVETLIGSLHKLETLLESFRNTKDETSTSNDKIKENCDAEDAEDQRCVWLKKVENKLDILKKHIKMLSEGKKPPNLKLSMETKTTTKSNKKKFQNLNSRLEKNHYYQNTGYSRGRIAHNVSNQRGKGRGRNQSVAKSAVPSGGWGILKSYESGNEPGFVSENQNFRGGLNGAGRFIGRGRGFSDEGGFSGRGRSLHNGGGFSDRGRGFSSVGHFMGRGRGDFRGRRRGDMRGRGRIAQNNIDAKEYAEKCKELNKVPEVCFKGVNMKAISGYAADVDVYKNSPSGNQSSSVAGVTTTKESVAAVNTAKKVAGGFSEVVVKT